MNADMLAAATALIERFDFDLVHSHDWLVAGAAERLRDAARRPVDRDRPRHRARPPPGLGRQAPAVAHPRGRAADGPPRRPRHRVLGVHARPHRRRLRAAGRPHHRDPERHRPVRPAHAVGPRRAAREVRGAGREARPARRPARLREGLPGRARGARQPPQRRPAARARTSATSSPAPARTRRSSRRRRGGCGSSGAGRSPAGSATTRSTGSTGSPTSA